MAPDIDELTDGKESVRGAEVPGRNGAEGVASVAAGIPSSSRAPRGMSEGTPGGREMLALASPARPCRATVTEKPPSWGAGVEGASGKCVDACAPVL
mmetsp:Transcript_11981/g.33053  ORF Transcript_11981/g.33053 Transcript_11981/m.33053 type:complete len:97 (+) Transcript_11981:168-458(+)